MVMLNESFQIIEKTMNENIVVRNRGGGCIVKQAPLFSSDGKYIYILCGQCVSAYSVETGECVYQIDTNNKADTVCLATYGQYLLCVSHSGELTIWRPNVNVPFRTLKLQLNGESTVAEIHPINSQKKGVDFDLVVAIREKPEGELKLRLHSSKTGILLTNLYTKAQNKPQSVTACDEYVAAINHQRLTVVPFEGNKSKNSLLAGQGRSWTVVRCAPEGRGLATGDSTGRIVLWHQPLENNGSRVVYHWHTLPVTTIAFSPTGSYMYSGGGEGVMVRWNMEVANMRNFLPRLPATIRHLSVSTDNQHVAVATADNSIHLLDSQNRVSCVIQKLSWGIQPLVSGVRLFPAGLVWDPYSHSIILNGRPGHVQFFNTDDNKLLYNLEIIGQNYLSQEREKEIINAEVTHVAISHDGKWLVTVETRDDKLTFLESLLKFWQYKFNAREFSLNTCIQLPHQGPVNAIKFQPLGIVPDNYLLVTSGADGKFRMWVPSISESIHSEGLRWVCDSVGYYRSQPARCLAFSSDGSVLGVTFGPSLTLWDADTCQLNTSLTWEDNDLRAVEFGSGDCSHLVVSISDDCLMVWNILTLCMVWCTRLRATLLCADPLSPNMAVFTDNNSVFVFLPTNPKPLFEKKHVCNDDDSVLAAIFVPRSHTLLDTNSAWCSKSQLHFITNNQRLQYLELECEQDPEGALLQPVKQELPQTPFSVLAARQSTSGVDSVTAHTHIQLGTAADTAVRQLLKNPASTMPHIHLFCNSFLKSLAISRGSDKEAEAMRIKPESEMEVDEDDSETPPHRKPIKKERALSESRESSQSHKKGIKEKSSKRRQRKKSKDKNKSPKKKQNSFTIEDLNSDWLNVFEDR